MKPPSIVRYTIILQFDFLFNTSLHERLHSLNDSTSAILVLSGQRVAKFAFIKEKTP